MLRIMANINELIGIIKGISFDEIINQQEVERLYIWLDENRSIFSDTEECKLIAFVDEILENKVLTLELQEKLLTKSQQFILYHLGDNVRIFELNGILEGIICDGIVNEQEIYRLKTWMSKYRNLLQGHQYSQLICDKIDEILQDGIVTDLEMEQLYELLVSKIGNLQLNSKIEDLCSQVRNEQNIGNNLIELLNDEIAINIIHSKAEMGLRELLRFKNVKITRNGEIIFISLVLVAMMNYDGKYYEYVEHVYPDLYDNYSAPKIEGKIRDVLNKYRKAIPNIKVRQINAVLENAIVPQYFLTSFFEFIFDIYKLNFDYCLSDDLYDAFQFVYEGLAENLSLDSDDMQVNVTRKSYKLIRSTKRLIVDAQTREEIIHLSIIVVKLIDQYIWGQDIDLKNVYLRQGYEGWKATFVDHDISSRNRTSSDFGSISKLKYCLAGHNIYIVPPVHYVKSVYDYRSIKIEVYNNQELVYCNSKPKITEIIGGYKVQIDKILLKNPLGTVEYKLLSGDEVIYESQDKLHRDIMVFDIDGLEISNNTNYSGVALFVCKNLSYEMQLYYTAEEYNVFEKSVELGEVCFLDGYEFTFSKITKPCVLGHVYPKHYICETKNNDMIPVYQSVSYIMFEVEQIAYLVEIIINGRTYTLSDFEFKVEQRATLNKYWLTLSLQKYGIYNVAIYKIVQGERTKITELRFALDKILNGTLNQVSQEDAADEQYYIEVVSDFYSRKVSQVISTSEIRDDMLMFQYKRENYCYVIPFDFEVYKIDEMPCQSMSVPLWIDDINDSSKLRIYGNIDKVSVVSDAGSVLVDAIEFEGREMRKFLHIGFLKSYKLSSKYVKLIFWNGTDIKNVLYCYNQCVLNYNATEIVFDSISKTLDILPVFYGKGNVQFTIVRTDNNEVCASGHVNSGEHHVVHELDSFVKYEIKFFELCKRMLCKKQILFAKIERIFYGWDDFVGRTFKIDRVYFDQLIGKRMERKKHNLNKNYVTFTQTDGDNFIGIIFAKNYKGDFYLHEINPVTVEICGDVNDGEMELAMDKDGDGLLLDFDYHCVKNSIDDSRATDIFSYIINVEEI